MNILYCGDQDRAPLYIEGALHYNAHSVTHVGPHEAFPDPSSYEVVILSDYPAENIDENASTVVSDGVARGARLIMLGGWESFNGFGRNYFNHPLAELLPVTMQPIDDRVNAPQGLLLNMIQTGNAVTQPNWGMPPVICGYNNAKAKEGADVLVEMRAIQSDGHHVSFGDSMPLVIRGQHKQGITVACLTDLAPHWSGGVTDWGEEFMHLPNGVDVGSSYLRFVQFLVEA